MSVPFALEGDTLSLSNEFILKNNYLIDEPLGANHRLRPKAQRALSFLTNPVDYRSWEKQAGLAPEEISGLLEFLNHSGALQLKRSPLLKLTQWLRRIGWRLQGVNLASPTWRRPATLRNVAVATLRVTAALWLSWPLVVLAVYGSEQFDPHRFVWVSGSSLLLILASLIAHEYAHVLSIYRAGKSGSVIQQGFRLGILHSNLGRKWELISALAGPVIGAATAILLGLIASRFIEPTLFRLGLIAGIAHGASWLPWYGDGQTLIREIR